MNVKRGTVQIVHLRVAGWDKANLDIVWLKDSIDAAELLAPVTEIAEELGCFVYLQLLRI